MYVLEGQRVVVTAAAAGIGLGIARCCRAAGAEVFICDIDAKAVARVATDQPGVKGLVADVGDPSSVEELFRSIFEEWAGIDLLVNNAGIAGPIKPAEEVTYEEWDRTIRVNLSGMFYCARQVIPAMKKRRRGCIINISSCSAKVGMTKRSPYVTSKVGVHGLTLALARELGPHNIRCNAILPGGARGERLERLIEAEMDATGKSYQEIQDGFVEFVSMRTLVDPEDIGDMVVFLGSDAGKRVTGQMISVDGNTEWEK
jgi:NAD(P)-dependent dehydrogenase (short-subunit alcohol dehydrogenase family)